MVYGIFHICFRILSIGFKAICKKAGLENITLHTLRHTFASQLALAGVPLRDIQELMGHQSFQTTLQYAHLTEEHVKKQVMKLPFAGSFREPKAQIRHNTPKVIDLLPQSKVLSNL